MMIFEQNELAVVETCMTILMWWGYGWNTLFPNPALQITSAIENVLKLHDKTLYDHLRNVCTSPGVLGWRILCTVFSEILSREDWLSLMDYTFLHYHQPQYMIFIPVAILRASRISLLHAGDKQLKHRFLSDIKIFSNNGYIY
jgi:hypothetical protein